MSENRATKSGIARDVQEKLNKKYDVESASRVMQWLAEATGESFDTSGSQDSVYEALKDGYVLNRLVNKMKENCIPESSIKRQNMRFKQMEMIERFNNKMKNEFGVAEYCLFASVDLVEKQNLYQVITCLEAVGRKCLTLDGCKVAGFGPKESEANKRDFSEEQLAQGKSIIGLQMGSNKGATQAGQSFGKARMIVD